MRGDSGAMRMQAHANVVKGQRGGIPRFGGAACATTYDVARAFAAGKRFQVRRWLRQARRMRL